MNGVALLVALSALSVDHTWRKTDDGQVEYVLQIEPVFLQALAEGKQITSQIPAGAERLDRLCIRVGSGNLKSLPLAAPNWPELNPPAERQAAGVAGGDVPLAIYVAADGQAYESYDLTHGWRAAGGDASDYLVQMDPEFLKTLQDGDELYALVQPDAGSVQSFIISAGRKTLPREAGKPPVRTVAQFQASDSRSSSPAADVPPTTDLTADQGGSIYGPTAEGAPTGDRNDARVDRNSTGGWNFGNRDAGSDPAEARGADPRVGPLQPPSTSFSEIPPFDSSQFDNRAESSAPPSVPSRSKSRFGGNPSAAENRYQNRPASSQSRETYAAASEPIDPADYQQQEAPGYRTASRSNPTRTASQEPLPRRAPTSNDEVEQKTPEFPTLPFSMSLFALFLSLGANLYLAWTAAEFYNRYKLTVERLRNAGR